MPSKFPLLLTPRYASMHSHTGSLQQVRIRANAKLVLKEESHFFQVIKIKIQAWTSQKQVKNVQKNKTKTKNPNICLLPPIVPAVPSHFHPFPTFLSGLSVTLQAWYYSLQFTPISCCWRNNGHLFFSIKALSSALKEKHCWHIARIPTQLVSSLCRTSCMILESLSSCLVNTVECLSHFRGLQKHKLQRNGEYAFRGRIGLIGLEIKYKITLFFPPHL